jgi:hypothetical protein
MISLAIYRFTGYYSLLYVLPAMDKEFVKLEKSRRPYFSQKINLYFDENFPPDVIDELKCSKRWKSKCRFYSVYDFCN